MDFNATIDYIIRELEEAREIIDDLKKLPGVPALQVELAKSKCKSASEVISILKNLPESARGISDEKTKVQKEANVPITENTSGPSLKTEAKQEKEEVVHFDIEEPEEKAIASHDEEISPDHPPRKSFVAPIIADSFSHLANSFNEQMGTKKDEDDLSNFIKRKHLNSLSDAIGINDRFYYIREIFNGNREAYSQAISRLDKAENLTEAKVVLMSYKNDQTENEAINQLLDLIKRKFATNE